MDRLTMLEANQRTFEKNMLTLAKQANLMLKRIEKLEKMFTPKTDKPENKKKENDK